MSKSSDLFWKGVLKYISIGVLIFLFFSPASLYRLLYPYMFAKPIAGKFQISDKDFFADLENTKDFQIKS